jgi:hypothetical protein
MIQTVFFLWRNYYLSDAGKLWVSMFTHSLRSWGQSAAQSATFVTGINIKYPHFSNNKKTHFVILIFIMTCMESSQEYKERREK